DWLRAELRYAAKEMGQPAAIQFTAILIGRADRDASAAGLRSEILDRQTGHLADMLAAAFEQGEIVAVPDPRELLARLIGPLLYHVTLAGQAASDAFVDALVDETMRPWLVVPPPGSETT